MLKLYYSAGTIALAPHILLCELGEPFEVTRVAVAENEHRNYKTPEFLKISARGLVPVLEIGNSIITESVAIALYLTELAPTKQWLSPMGSIERARAYQWLAWLATSVLRAIGGIYRPEHITDDVSTYPSVKNFAKSKLEGQFTEIEQEISSVNGYFLGDNFGVVDPFLLVFYRWGVELGLDMNRFERWTQLSVRMLTRPAVSQALNVEGIGIKGLIV
jgi:glutathione S-transferase